MIDSGGKKVVHIDSKPQIPKNLNNYKLNFNFMSIF